jgi:hypothetical protein
MYAGAVLHIHPVADADNIHIATDYRVEPDAAVIPHHHIAGDGGIGGDKAIISPTG